MQRQTRLTRLALSAAIVAALVSAPAFAADSGQSTASTAQNTQQKANAKTTQDLEQVVVTGAPTYAGVKKIDASFSITTANDTEIKKANPSSSADLLKIVPGIWAESSGGQTGANIELAGFPGGGDAPFVTFALNGSAVYPTPTLSFMANGSLFRIDDTIQRVEVLQGGPSTVYGNGQIGATANFILRQGTAKPSGDIGVTYGSEGLYRVDGFYGGKLSDNWFFSVGGFYRTSDGVRSPQFPADEGGQLTATLSRDFDNGDIMFYARSLNDKNLFITDVPVRVSADGKSVSQFQNFDPLTGTFASNELRSANFQVSPGNPPGSINADLAKGRGSDIHMFGSNLNMYFDNGWTLSNKFHVTAGHMPTNALFNNFSPESFSQYLNGEIANTNGNPDIVTAAGGMATGGSGTYVNGGGMVDPNQAVASLGFWVVDKKIRSFSDEFRLSTQLSDNNTLTMGTYLASYSSDDHWYLGNNMLVTAENNARLIDASLNNGVQLSRNGVISGPFYALTENWSGRNVAGYISDQWTLGKWTLDAGWRVEHQKADGTVSNDTSMDLDGNPLTAYNNNTAVENGSFTPISYSHTHGSWTVGANYEITPHMSVYGRVNEGVHFPGFDDLRSGQANVQRIKNFEAGFKFQNRQFYTSLTAFRRIFSGVPYQQFTADGNNVTSIYGASSHGLNFTARYSPTRNLSFDLTGNWQDSVYAHYYSAAVGTSPGFDYNGNVLQRQPRLQFRFTPDYDMPTSWGDLNMFVTYTHVGFRYSDIGNSQPLPSYYTLGAGVVANVGQHLQFRLQGSNLTNQIGLTEGNARVTDSGVSNGLEMVRPIFGREVFLQAKYKL
ncbi:TonB-dependent receptor [Oleiagrimonas citrea]|uniref:TonB-dependent receptor n=1 Tax=Oleiagrimonas citrea TaxID=1665687 RepID=A0A846ZNG5_9GAMM|nr:TonB-dependent receptor [Oleiagrimonas citrea]NKZ39546.1 TonB-dependent receptor [Oleiagrimonas citrea]